MDSQRKGFWLALERLVHESEVIIDRPKGTCHPRWAELIYPVDYGYLKGTTSMDGGGIDVWHGSSPRGRIDAIICTVSLRKKDAEIKILIGCTAEEKTLIVAFHNQGDMSGILVERYTPRTDTAVSS